MDKEDKKSFMEFIRDAHKKTMELARLLDKNNFSFKESIYSCIAMACLDSMDVKFSKKDLHDLLDEIYTTLEYDGTSKTIN